MKPYISFYFMHFLMHTCVLFHLDFSSDVKQDKLLRVGHVCATCFVNYNWAFRLLWLHCFEPHDHQFAGTVCAVFYSDGIGKKPVLCRVRPFGMLQKCPNVMCSNGRRCPKAHSGVELHYWNKLQQGKICIIFSENDNEKTKTFK